MAVRSTMVELVLLVIVSMGCYLAALAQTITPPASPGKKASTPAQGIGPIIVENQPTAPQVVTILHRLNGLKMFRLLLRSDTQLQAITQLDQAYKLMGDVHTNVIAGVALEDGQTIAAWLPEVEAELGPPSFPFAFFAPAAPGVPPPPAPPMPALTRPLAPRTSGDFSESPDVTVIARDGKRFLAHYVGLDGVTGLSILKLSTNGLRSVASLKGEGIDIGQRLRLFGPEPAAGANTGANIYVRVGATVGIITSLVRVPSGGIAKLKLRSARLSTANIGGIAVDDQGDTIGIVDGVEGGEASIVPADLIRSAAKRVLERQSSVPRPWLGVRGEPIGTLAVQQLLSNGWSQQEAALLAEKRHGILLTSVAPGSPADIATLRPGDVILKVNGEEVRTADEFTWCLEEAGPGGSVQFSVAHPGEKMPEPVQVKLSESSNPDLALKLKRRPPVYQRSALITQGLETIALKPAVASRFGANGGLLVVYVQPDTAAFKAGLRLGDVIESIDGQPIASIEPMKLASAPGTSFTVDVVRNRQKLVFTLVTSPK